MADNPEPYRALVLERQRIQATKEWIDQALLTSGRKRRKLMEHAAKHRVIMKEYFGTKVVFDGAIVLPHEQIHPAYCDADSYRRFR